jgi:excisionase family DNA binding protein
MDDDSFLTVREFCDRFKLSPATTYRLAGRGELRLLKLGRHTRISMRDARAWADGLRAKANP